MDYDYDYIVIGAGINGTWTGYHLAKLEKKVLVIEQVVSLRQAQKREPILRLLNFQLQRWRCST
jgi:glycine/D-amino acid oxidase-like deaminating enzyme